MKLVERPDPEAATNGSYRNTNVYFPPNAGSGLSESGHAVGRGGE
jgi:hypothetical protein